MDQGKFQFLKCVTRFKSIYSNKSGGNYRFHFTMGMQLHGDAMLGMQCIRMQVILMQSILMQLYAIKEGASQPFTTFPKEGLLEKPKPVGITFTIIHEHWSLPSSLYNIHIYHMTDVLSWV